MDALTTLLAAALGFAGALGAVALTQRHQAKSELTAALAHFLAELDAVAIVVRRSLRMPRWIARTNAWLERRLPLVDALSEDLMRATIGRDITRQEHQFRVAANRVLLIAPPELKHTVVETLQLLQAAEGRDADWLDRWLALRDTLQNQARRAVGAEPRRWLLHRPS